MAGTILVTGGAGYIGSHTVVELLNQGYRVLVLDNFSNSRAGSIHRVEQIVGKTIPFVRGDILDRSVLREIFTKYEIAAVLHFAGLKAVGESVVKPLLYYQNNVCGTLTLCEEMENFGIKSIVFSSSATVYGEPKSVPIDEGAHVGNTTNPYGTSKYFAERILEDFCKADLERSAICLRYFNPAGAHRTGLIGENPAGVPNNLLPYISQVAIGKLKKLSVYGNDYLTKDGTGVRDYIHVTDLAKGHISALNLIEREGSTGFDAINLGTGVGYTVLEVIKSFERQSSKNVPFEFVDRRNGDIGVCYSDPRYAEARLGWKAELGLDEMMRDAWSWQSKNPRGYEGNKS